MNNPQQFLPHHNKNINMQSAGFPSDLDGSANNYAHPQSMINKIHSPTNHLPSNTDYNQTMQMNLNQMQGQQQPNPFSQSQGNMYSHSQFNDQNRTSLPPFQSNFQIDPNQFRPYEKQEFLDDVFHFNDYYIEAFHTLPHETKLKFYLYVEEVKMLGHMTNKEDYQTILKEIARRVVFLHPESQQAKQIQQKQEDEEQKKKKQWMNKMENLVEGHLIKIQKDDFLDDIPITSPTFYTQGNAKKNLTLDFLSDDNYLQTEIKRQHPSSSFPQNSLDLVPPSQTEPSQKINNDEDDEEFEWSQPATPNAGEISEPIPFSQQNQKPKQEEQQQWEWNGNDSSTPQSQIPQFSTNHNYMATYQKPVQQKREVIDVWDIAVEEQQPRYQEKPESFSNKDNNSISHSNQATYLDMETDNNVLIDQNHIKLVKHSYSGQENKYAQSFEDYPKQPLSATVQHNAMGMDFMDIDFNGSYSGKIQDFEMYRQQSYYSQNVGDSGLHDSEMVYKKDQLNQGIPSKVENEDQWGAMQGQDNPITHPMPVEIFNSMNSIDMQQEYSHTDTYFSEQMDRNVKKQASMSEEGYSNGYQASYSQNGVGSQKFQNIPGESVSKPNIEDNIDDDEDFQWQEPKQQVQKEEIQPKIEIQASGKYNANDGYYNAPPRQEEPFLWDSSPAITNTQYTIQDPIYTTTVPTNTVPFTNDDIFSTGLFQFTSPTTKTPLQQPIIKVEENIDDEDQEIYTSNALIPHDNSQYENDQILQNLKIQYFSQTCQQMQKSLNVNGFEYEKDFYPQAIQLISSLLPPSALKQSKDYELILSQQQICEQIFRLTELYTAAVEEDQEQKVISTLNQSKELHKKISPTTIKKVLNKYMKMRGMGINFQIGRLGLQAGIPRVLVEKSVTKGLHKFKQTMAVLYLLEYLGNIHSTPLYVTSLIEYLQSRFEEMGDIGSKLGMISSDTGTDHEFNDLKVKQFVKNNQKFIEYKKSLALISIITKRMIVLGKLCLSSGELHPNLLKLHKKIRDVSSAIGSTLQQHTTIQDDDVIIGYSYVEAFENVAALYSKATVYELYAQFMNNMQKNPICCLCLLPAEWEDQPGLNLSGKQSDDKVYHYSCWNLQIAVRRYKQSQCEKIQQQKPEEQTEYDEKTIKQEEEHSKMKNEGQKIQAPCNQEFQVVDGPSENNIQENTESMGIEEDQFEQQWH